MADAMPASFSITAPSGMPMVTADDDLAWLIADTLDNSGITLEDGDIVAVAQKVVSKAEGRMVALDSVTPSARAREIAGIADKDPRLVELILSETDEVLRVRRGVIIVRHRLGFVLANAGIDQSNVDHGDGAEALLLPRDPELSSANLRKALQARTGVRIATMIIDSFGRAWRNGTIGTAIGVSGMPGLHDLRGTPDLFGRALQTSEIGLADEVAAAASLLMGQADEGRPVVVIRGLTYALREGSAAELLRQKDLDLFQ